MKRRVPRPRELAPLLQFRKPQLNATKRRLAAALTIEDLRGIAKRRTPKAAFDYTDGAAEEELSLARARRAFRDIEFHPTILRDVAKVDTGRHRARRPGRAAVRHRADRLHPAHADRRRDGRRPRRGTRRDSVLAVHAGHQLDRGRQGGEPARAATGFSCTCGRTGTVRWRWWSAPPRRASTPCSSRSTSRSPVPGYATPATACPSRRR